MTDIGKDGLTRSQRHRLKNLAAYRAKKAAYARSPAQRKKRNEYMQRWKKANPDKNKQYIANRWKKHRLVLIARMREFYHKSRYGLTTAQALELKRTTPCGICGKLKRVMAIDHDHKIKTPSYRGILCVTCNTHLGWLESVGADAVQKYLSK